MGMSGWRRLVFYSDLLTKVNTEGRHSDIKSESERLKKVMVEDNVTETTVDDSTLKRYIQLGKRLSHHRFCLTKFEAFHQRNALIDSCTNLRAVFGCSDVESDSEYILEELFMQQRADIRKTLQAKSNKRDPRVTTNICKAILLKRSIFMFLVAEFPKLADAIEPYKTFAYFSSMFNISSDGTKQDSTGNSETEPEPDDDTLHVVPAEAISSQESKRMLVTFCKRIRNLQFDHSLCKMATSENFTFAKVDLSHPEAAMLKKSINDIKEAYTRDFPPPVEQKGMTRVQEGLTIVFQEEDLTEASYAMQRKLFDEASGLDKKRVCDHMVDAITRSQSG